MSGWAFEAGIPSRPHEGTGVKKQWVKHRRLNWARLFRGRRKHIFQTVFANSLVCIAALLMIAIVSIYYFTDRLLTDSQGQSRVEVLQQLCSSNAVNRTNMVNMMDSLYTDYHDLLMMAPSGETNVIIRQKLRETARMLRLTGLDFTVDILMNDKREFTTGTSDNLKILKNTYWYIKHYAGETDTSWNLRFLDAEDLSSYGLSYGKTIYDDQGRSVGVIVITSAYEVLFRTFQELLNDGSKVYILDQNGIIICHSNRQRVGNWMTSIDAFEKKYGYNSYTVFKRGTDHIMLSNFKDADSGWVFVEERNVNRLLTDGLSMCKNYLMAVAAGSVAVAIYMYFRIKRITDSLAELTLHISQMPVEQLAPLPVRDEYDEIFILGNSFNEMIGRIHMLIRDIEQRKAEKQKTEYDFLQAQINPHFLNNTLLAVKSLLVTNRIKQAGCMMEELIEMLHIPVTPEVQYVTLAEELHLVKSYISIMNYRTDKGVSFFPTVPEDVLSIPVPRLILQPLVGNSFFHGFAEREGDCCIRLRAFLHGGSLCIEVEDNGEGIAPERLRQLKGWSYHSDKTHHGIGLKNVRQRLQILYGSRSGVEVESTEGKGTVVRVILDQHRCVRGRKAAAEEAGYENHSSR